MTIPLPKTISIFKNPLNDYFSRACDNHLIIENFNLEIAVEIARGCYM